MTKSRSRRSSPALRRPAGIRSWTPETDKAKLETQVPPLPSQDSLTSYGEQVEVPQSLIFEVSGSRFLIVSDQPDFLQGRPTSSENYKKLRGIQDSLKRQKSLLIDFQGEMLGHAGEVYFAVLKPTDLLTWTSNFRSDEWKETKDMVSTAAPVSVSKTDTSAAGHCQQAECPGFILDLVCPANVELLRELLKDEKILKVGWGCQHDLEGLMHQHHPILEEHGKGEAGEASVRNLLVQQQSLRRCSDFQPPWEILEFASGRSIVEADDADKLHKYNQRVNRRPFPHTFLKNAACEILALEEVVRLLPTEGYACSEAWMKTRSLIQEVRHDRDGLWILEQRRNMFLEQTIPLTDNAAAIAVKYLRHFARIPEKKKVLEKLEPSDLQKHKDVMQHLQRWISLDVERQCLPMPFQGDQIDSFICKVLRDFRGLSKEDETMCSKFFIDLLPQGVSMLHFRDPPSLQNWAKLLEERCGYELKQDTAAFFLEASTPDSLHHLEFPEGSSRRLASAGAWWGLKKHLWGKPGCETQKRALQAIAWLFFQRGSEWRHFSDPWAFIAHDVRKLRVFGRRVRSVHVFDGEKLIFVQQSKVQRDVGKDPAANQGSQGCSVTREQQDCDVLGHAECPWPWDDTFNSVAHYSKLHIHFVFGGRTSWQRVPKMTYISACETIQKKASEWHLKAYIAELIETSKGKQGCEMTEGAWESLLERLPAGRISHLIEVRLREVKVEIYQGGQCIKTKPFDADCRRWINFEPAATYERIVKSVDKVSLAGLFFNPRGRLIELTVDEVADFIQSSWTDSSGPMVLSVYLKTANVPASESHVQQKT